MCMAYLLLTMQHVELAYHVMFLENPNHIIIHCHVHIELLSLLFTFLSGAATRPHAPLPLALVELVTPLMCGLCAMD